jgi:hypothetical protein
MSNPKIFKVLVPSYNAFREHITQCGDSINSISGVLSKRQDDRYIGVCDDYKYRKVFIPRIYVELFFNEMNPPKGYFYDTLVLRLTKYCNIEICETYQCHADVTDTEII